MLYLIFVTLWPSAPPAFIWLEITKTSLELPYALSTLLTLSEGSSVSSVSLVRVTSAPKFLNLSAIYDAIFKVNSFSIIPLPIAPESVPPCRGIRKVQIYSSF